MNSFTALDRINRKIRLEGARERLNAELAQKGKEQLNGAPSLEGVSDIDENDLIDPHDLWMFFKDLPTHLRAKITERINGLITTDTLFENQAIAEPLVEGGVIGDLDARNEYQRTRLLHQDQIPLTLWKMIEEHGASAFLSEDYLAADFKFLKGKQFKATLTAIRSGIRQQENASIDFILDGYFLAKSFFTYESMEQGLEYFEDNLESCDSSELKDSYFRSHNPLATEDEIYEHIKLFNEALLPTSDSEAGRFARNECRTLYNMMLKATILVDYLRLRGYSFTDSALRDIWHSYSEPWGIRQSKPIENLRKVDVYIKTKFPEVSSEDRLTIATQCMLAGDPIKKASYALREKPVQEDLTTKTEEPKRDYKPYSQSIKESLAALIQNYFPDEDQEIFLTDLYTRYKRIPEVTYDTVLEAFRKLKSRDDIIDFLDNLKKIKVTEVVSDEPETQSIEQNNVEDRYEIYFHRGESGKAIYQDTLREIRDEKAARRIHKAIEKLRLGIGDHVNMPGLAISELRLGNYRVYTYQKGRQIVVLGVGKKEDQPRDKIYYSQLVSTAYLH